MSKVKLTKDMPNKPINAAKSILALKKTNRNKARDSADEVIDKDDNKDKKPWWDMFGIDFSCCGTDRNEDMQPE